MLVRGELEMQVSTIILIVGALQLLLLIAEVYLVTSLRVYYSVRFSGYDILLLVVQICNLIFLLQCFAGYINSGVVGVGAAIISDGSIAGISHATSAADMGRISSINNIGNIAGIGGINIGNTGVEWMLFGLQGIIILLLLFRFSRLLHRLVEHRQRLLKPRAIRETVDYLPSGICFAAPSGSPLLTNRKMNELIFRLTGHVIMNVRLAWDELCTYTGVNGCVKLNDPWISSDYFVNEEDEEAEAGVFFSLPDNSIWQFQLKELTDDYPHYIQLEATDISELYELSRELYDNNQRLAEQYERQQRLLSDIVEINHAKEILSMKMRIHDDLGRSILTTKQHLSNGTLTENIPSLSELWSNTIRCLEDYTQIYTDSASLPEIELQKAADMIGCRISYSGERPVGRKTTLLFYAAVREALTNAVRHAAANELYVMIQSTAGGYHVEIADNGNKPVFLITEGNGLSNLRRRLEQEGASLKISRSNGVVLSMELPAEGRELSLQDMPAKDILMQESISQDASVPDEPI